MNNLTPIQCKVLDFIIQEVRQHALPPTHREISKAFAWRSNAAAKCHLLALEKKGFIRTRTRISRGIELKPTALEWTQSAQSAPVSSLPG
jgi:repressor LexA